MANQYSITVSNKANSMLMYMKNDLKMMPSRVISTLIETLGVETMKNIYERARIYNEFIESGESKVIEYHVKKVRSVMEERKDGE